MRRIFFCSFVSFLLISPVWTSPVFQKGMSYPAWSWNVLSLTKSSQSIAAMREIGVEWAALCVFWFQDNENSSVITEDPNRYSASRPSTVKAIADLHAAGIKVLLKPMVGLRNGEWCGTIKPSDAWFDAYEAYIADWAKFAADNGVEIFCIGCEFVEAARYKTWAPYWRRIADSVRAVYPGPITYASNHGNEQNIYWWDAVDYIGIDAYYALSSQDNPTLAELTSAWKKQADKIESWRNRVWPDRPVLFTEIGYRSFDGASRQPWDWQQDDPAKVDLQEQVDCYSAALEVLTARDWFYGFYWWNWETNPNAGGPSDTGYTPQNKPVQALLSDWYRNRLMGGRFSGIPSEFFYEPAQKQRTGGGKGKG
ncbi:MAG: hypothetical protein AB1656_16850 [Candidatus Omnitrophota bacterium]